MKYYVKVCYRRIFKIFILPLFHTFFEIKYKNKIRKIGFYNKDGKKSLFFFFASIILPVRGVVAEEAKKADKHILITRDRKKVKNILEEIKNNNWKTYHALFRNCFHWRDAVLKVAGIRN